MGFSRLFWHVSSPTLPVWTRVSGCTPSNLTGGCLPFHSPFLFSAMMNLEITPPYFAPWQLGGEGNLLLICYAQQVPNCQWGICLRRNPSLQGVHCQAEDGQGSQKDPGQTCQ